MFTGKSLDSRNVFHWITKKAIFLCVVTVMANEKQGKKKIVPLLP